MGVAKKMKEKVTNEIDNEEINGFLFSEELYLDPEKDMVKILFWSRGNTCCGF